MARRFNELFIGRENLSIEGLSIKHPALIKLYANVNVNKVDDKPINLLGIDLETNHKTGELKLLGFWNGEQYMYYLEDFLSVLIGKIKGAYRDGKSLAYWNKLDPFVLYKQILLLLSPEEQEESMKRFGKIGGEWDNQEGRWKVSPVCEIKIHDMHFGILNVIRSSIQFFTYIEGDTQIKKVWAYDIAQLFESGLEKEAQGRLPYYEKGDESLHKIDWIRFEKDKEFRKAVLHSNELDARAVYDLGYIIQEEFKQAFKYYPRTLVSQGSLARTAIVATLRDKYMVEFPDNEDKVKHAVLEELRSIGLINYYDEWLDKFGEDTLKDLYALSMEAYSGGYIEALQYGYAPVGYYSDIASAYPAVIMKLWDLRDAKITRGKGIPPRINNSYCFIRGYISVPLGVNIHPITIKHPVHKETNIRAVGDYRASYTLNERDFLLSVGATFTNEEWFNIETTGKLSPLADVAKHFIDLRTMLRSQGNSAQYMAKIAVNSMYGILFEAVDTYEEQRIKRDKAETSLMTYEDEIIYKTLKGYQKQINLTGIATDLKHHYDVEYSKIKTRWHKSDGLSIDVVANKLISNGIHLESINPSDQLIELNTLYEDASRRMHQKQTTSEFIKDVFRAGYRAGEFFNPIYATIITSETRLLISKSCKAIEEKGGKPILIMTDSIFWTGSADMMPEEFVREKKTVGYFEKVKEVNDIVCLGSGRYSFKDGDEYTSKKRGLNHAEIEDENGIILNDFNWLDAVKIMAVTNKEVINIQVTKLISVGVVLYNSHYQVEDLGRVVEVNEDVNLIVGKTKRYYGDSLKNPSLLAKQLMPTESIIIAENMYGNGQIADQTFPELRYMMMQKHCQSAKERDRQNRSKASTKYNKKASPERNKAFKEKYDQICGYGYTSYEANKMKKWSAEKIMNQLILDGKI